MRDSTPHDDGTPSLGTARTQRSERGSIAVKIHPSQHHQTASPSSGIHSVPPKVHQDTEFTSESPVVIRQVDNPPSEVSKPHSQVSKPSSHVSKPSSQVRKPPSQVSKSSSRTPTVTSQVSKLQTPIEEKRVHNISVHGQSLKQKTPDSLTVHTPSSSMVPTEPYTAPASNGRITAIGNKDDSKDKPRSSVQERTVQYTFSDLQVKAQGIVKMSDKEKRTSPLQVEPVSDSDGGSPKDGANAIGCGG